MRRVTGVVMLLVVCGAVAGVALAGTSKREALGIARVASGFSNPVFVTAPRSEPASLYVVEQPGVVRVLVRGKLRAEPFLDVRSLVVSGGEQGLLGLAFDPGYAKNRRLYVDFTGKDGDTYVYGYRSDGRRAIPSSRKLLLHVDQPYPNHNGGMLAFGPDGKLYVGMGDGGSGGDPENRAQSPDSLLGKLLRLDPLGKAKPQIAALGLRNPWRFSFDRKTGDLVIGDVGQNKIEEVDYVPAGNRQLLNFGWRVYEGRSSFQPGDLGPGTLTEPIAQYTHDLGCSVIGGYVYRGKAVRAAAGRYFYGDACSGTIWSFVISGGRAGEVRTEVFKVPSISSFGESASGELYLVSLGGTIYRLKS